MIKLSFQEIKRIDEKSRGIMIYFSCALIYEEDELHTYFVFINDSTLVFKHEFDYFVFAERNCSGDALQRRPLKTLMQHLSSVQHRDTFAHFFV